MSANLFGERFMGFRTAAWHNLGTVFTTPISAVDATLQAKMDYNVIKAPLSGEIATPFGTMRIPLQNKFALVREPTGEALDTPVFGIVGEDYQIVQNLELATLLDTLTGGWPLETIGAIGQGETVFYTLSVGKGIVGGDELDLYFLVTDTKDGKSSLRIAFTPIRVVCQNTLTSGLRQSTVNVALSHNLRLADDIKWRMDLLKKLQDAKENTLDTFQKMAEVVLSGTQIEEVLAASYPQPTKPAKLDLAGGLDLTGYEGIAEHLTSVQEQWMYYCKQATVRRLEVKDRLAKWNDEFPATANTAWAVYNSVVENEDFRTGPSTIFESTVFGDRAKTKAKAMQASMAYIAK